MPGAIDIASAVQTISEKRYHLMYPDYPPGSPTPDPVSPSTIIRCRQLKIVEHPLLIAPQRSETPIELRKQCRFVFDPEFVRSNEILGAPPTKYVKGLHGPILAV
jgi:hypothetical protein